MTDPRIDRDLECYDPATEVDLADLHEAFCRRLRAQMREPSPGNNRRNPPPDMTIGFYGDYGANTGMVSTRIFAMPGGSCVELADTQRVPSKDWEAVATQDAWDWYDRYAP